MSFVERTLGVAFLAAALASVGCSSSYSAICEDAMGCVGGNDEGDVDACVAKLEEAEEHASIEECDDEWDELVSCMEEKQDCDNDNIDMSDCEDEFEDLDDCDDDLLGYIDF